MMADEIIKIKNLSTGYGDKVISEGLNAAIFGGEMTCLIGSNGAGKSTLLRTLSGMTKPLSGEIVLCSRPLHDYSAKMLSQTIGVVLTDRVSLESMSVEELVGLGRMPYTGMFGGLTKEDKTIVDEAIALVGIESLRNRMLATLSDGERQKSMVAKVIAQQTPIVFLDEPTAFLDFPSKVELMKLLRDLSRRKGLTVFMTTHDIDLALQSADRIWLLDRRQGLAIDTPERLAEDRILARYFNSENLEFDTDSRMFRIKF